MKKARYLIITSLLLLVFILCSCNQDDSVSKDSY
jgi:predicted small secreted protein